MQISGPTAAYDSIFEAQTSQVPRTSEQKSTRSNEKVTTTTEEFQNVHQARLDEIRSKVAQGTYSVGSAQIADALIRSFPASANQTLSTSDPGRSRSWTV